jgi:DNA mismatch repair protein MutS2
VALGGDYSTLIITGPNTGGKTVTLTTVGLFALMAQSGLHLPVHPGTEMPIFRHVCADIGDEQSIAQNLSTFSSHMQNIVGILKKADAESLVLLDELGAGTDPAEGAALAISILEELRRRGCRVMATTHYTELKKYALSAEGVENASMEFSLEDLAPTYRLQLGIPGSSNAFAISRKLGLKERIIREAARHLDEGELAFEDVIRSIEADRKAAEAERTEARVLRLAAEQEKQKLDAQQESLAAKREKLLEEAREEARAVVEEARAFSEQVHRELRELEDEPERSARDRKEEQLRRSIRAEREKYKEKLPEVPAGRASAPEELTVGAAVLVVSLDQPGRVLTLPDERGELQVQVGSLKINAKADNVRRIKEKELKRAEKGGSHGRLYLNKAAQISPSINVVGENLEDASLTVDKYLDDAFMAGLKEVSIVHGRGAGILREGLQRLCRQHEHVKSLRKGSYQEGGDGVTVVTLK